MTWIKEETMMTNRANTRDAAWRTSSYSTSGNQCVEVGPLPGGAVAVRDSTNRDRSASSGSPDAPLRVACQVGVLPSRGQRLASCSRHGESRHTADCAPGSGL